MKRIVFRILTFVFHAAFTLFACWGIAFGFPFFLVPGAYFAVLVLVGRAAVPRGASRIAAALAVAVGLPVFVYAIFTPLRAVVVLAQPWLFSLGVPRQALEAPLQAAMDLTGAGYRGVCGFDIAAGLCSLYLGTVGGLLALFYILRQARQVDILPTARARSAAMGLVELKGVARPDPKSGTGPDGGILYFSTRHTADSLVQNLRPFYLEDETGRVRVDPTAAQVRPGLNANFWERFHRIFLTRNVRPETRDRPEIRMLMPGDPVYVLGALEEDAAAPPDAADVDRCVVRPSTRKKSAGVIGRWLGGKDAASKGRDYHDVFILSDAPEAETRGLVRTAVAQASAYAVVWTALSVALIAVRLPRISSASWTPAEIVEFASPAERFPLLARRLADGNPAVRRAAVEALDAVQTTPAVVTALLERTDDPDAAVRTAAARAVWDVKAPCVVPEHVASLVRMSRSADARVRWTAAWSMGRLDPPPEAAVRAMGELLGDGDPRVRGWAAYALMDHGEHAAAAAPALLRALGDAHAEAYGISVGSAAHRALKRATLDPGEALPLLRPLLAHPDPDVRRRAVDLLGRLGRGGAAAAPDLMPLLDAADENVRWDAAETLWKLGRRDGSVPGVLCDALHRGGKNRQWPILTALKEAGPPDVDGVRPEIRLLTANDDDAIRRMALEAIAAWGTSPEDVPALIALVRRPIPEKPSVYGPDSSEARVGAIQALGAMGPAAREAVPALVERLADDGCFSRFREASVEALGRIGPPAAEALPALRDVYARLRGYCRGIDVQLGNQRIAVGRAVAGITAPPRPAGLPRVSDAPPKVRLRFDGALEGDGCLAPETIGAVPPAFVQGVRGRAAAFDGRQAVAHRRPVPLVLGKTFTLEGWFRVAPPAPEAKPRGQAVVDIGILALDVGENGGLRVKRRDGESFWYSHDVLPVEPGRWYHVAVVHDGYAGTVVEYVDGAEAHRDEDHWLSDWLQNDALELKRIGEQIDVIQFGMIRRGPPSFAGAVDEFALYDYVRTPGQIAESARRP